jgi:hypothetical protein
MHRSKVLKYLFRISRYKCCLFYNDQTRLMMFGDFLENRKKLNNRKNLENFKFKAGDKNSNHVQPNTRAEMFIYVEPYMCVCVCVRACVRVRVVINFVLYFYHNNRSANKRGS